MKTYSAYSRCSGPSEGAVLVFADSVKEAKKVAWTCPAIRDMTDGEYIDLAVSWLKASWLQTEKRSDSCHWVDNPKACLGCLIWGYELNEAGYCETCADDLEEE